MLLRVALMCWVVSAMLAAAASAADRPARIVPKLKLNHVAMEKLGWKIGSQAYTFREMSLFETIDVLHAMDVRYIELFPGQTLSPERPNVRVGHDMPADAFAVMQQKLQSANIQAVAYGVVGLGKDESGSRKVFEFCKKLGITTIHSEPGEDAFDTLAKLADEFQISVGVHNHPMPSHYWSPETVLKVANGRTRRIGACADTGHWYRSGLVPLKCLKKLNGRITSLHFKDLDESDGDVPFGTGVCSVKSMMKELKRQGFKGSFSIEYERTGGQELIDNVAQCIQYFSDVATELAE